MKKNKTKQVEAPQTIFKLFSEPVYCSRVLVAVSNDGAHFVETLQKSKLKVEFRDKDIKDIIAYDKGGCCYSTDSPLRYLIYLNCDLSVGCLAHECLHLVDKIFTDIGEPIHKKNAEPRAYLLGMYYNKIYDWLNGGGNNGIPLNEKIWSLSVGKEVGG